MIWGGPDRCCDIEMLFHCLHYAIIDNIGTTGQGSEDQSKQASSKAEVGDALYPAAHMAQSVTGRAVATATQWEYADSG